VTAVSLDARRGVVAGVIDSLLWAVTALYWPLLEPATDLEILGHRLVWAVLFMTLIVVVAGRARAFGALVSDRRTVLLLAAAAVAITVNWAGFIWGVNHGHVVEASLGYFINPLMTVLLGVGVLREQVRPSQWVAIGLALVAVLVVTLDFGHLPWYALMLSVTGGCYALFKKQADAGAFESLALETVIVAPVALVYLLYGTGSGVATFTDLGPGHALLLVGGGLVTVVPLLFYGYAATRLPLVTLGLLNYLAPLTTFALGVLYFGESLELATWLAFALIWAALGVFALDTVRELYGSGSAAATGATRSCVGGDARETSRGEGEAHGADRSA